MAYLQTRLCPRIPQPLININKVMSFGKYASKSILSLGYYHPQPGPCLWGTGSSKLYMFSMMSPISLQSNLNFLLYLPDLLKHCLCVDFPSIQISTEVVTFWMASKGYGCTRGKELDPRLLLKAWTLEGTTTWIELKLQGLMVSMANSTKHLKVNSILHNIFQKLE